MQFLQYLLLFQKITSIYLISTLEYRFLLVQFNYVT